MHHAASIGFFTGDAFTERIALGAGPRYEDVYLWVRMDGDCAFIDFYPDTKVWIHVDARGVRLKATDDDERQEFDFKKIKELWLQRGFDTLVIYSDQVIYA